MKKVLRLLLVLAALMLLFCAGAMAETASEKEMDKLCEMVDKANEKIESYVEHAQETEKNDIDWLQKKVDNVVEPVMKYAEKIGATVECEMTEYKIDGQTVLVDPLKVINLGDEDEDE